MIVLIVYLCQQHCVYFVETTYSLLVLFCNIMYEFTILSEFSSIEGFIYYHSFRVVCTIFCIISDEDEL